MFDTYTVRVFDKKSKFDEQWINPKDGLWHRENGPAVTFSNGHVEYYLKGQLYSKSAFDLKMNPPTKKMTVEEIQSELGYKIEIVETGGK
jgi:hypothetical protein